MPAQVTLIAHLDSILGGAALGGYLRITLCGFGPIVPAVPGASIADAGVPQQIGPQGGGGSISQLLWGNDQITPAGTFYEVAVLDAKRNVIQAGNYQFSQAGGAVNVNLETAAQIVPPYGFVLSALAIKPCAGAGDTFIATSATILGVFYNGVLLRPGQVAPILSYTKAAATITLNFITEAGDTIDALVVG
jgi:hypothetical protein